MSTLIPFLALLLSLNASFAHAETLLSLSDHGKPVTSLSMDALKAIAPPQTVRIYEPHEETEIEFQGVPLDAVLDRAFGPSWRKSTEFGELFFICADGYKDPISVERIAHHRAWLAFARTGDPQFELFEKSLKQKHALGPLFLIWDTLKDPEIKALGKEGWPFQIVGIDRVGFSDRYPGLTPPAGASAAAKQGYVLFKKHCVTCHSLGGQGGKVGPELNSPVSVTTYYKEAWLKKWIADPSQIRAGTAMPSVLPVGPGRAGAIDAIIAYLKAMAPKVRAP